MNQEIPSTNGDTITNVVAENWKKTPCGNIPPHFESDINLYFNPELSGGTDIVDGVGTPPDDHTISNNSNTISADIIGENPTYDINASFESGRLAFREVRGTTGDLIVGHRYLFSAEVWIEGYVDGVNDPQELRGVNVNNNASLVINRDNADLSGANGQWEYVEVIFDIIAPTTVIYLAHGQGVINTSTLRVQPRNLTLNDLGETPSTYSETYSDTYA